MRATAFVVHVLLPHTASALVPLATLLCQLLPQDCSRGRARCGDAAARAVSDVAPPIVAAASSAWVGLFVPVGVAQMQGQRGRAQHSIVVTV